MSRSLRYLKCSDHEPTMLFTGASTFLVGTVLLANPTLFVAYPQTFGILSAAADQSVWGVVLMGVGVLKWMSVECDRPKLAFWTTIVGMILWISITAAILLMRQHIPLVAFTAVSGGANCWLCVQVGKLMGGKHEQHHRPAPGDTDRDRGGTDHGDLRNAGFEKPVGQRRPNRVSARSHARQGPGIRPPQRVRREASDVVAARAEA